MNDFVAMGENFYCNLATLFVHFHSTAQSFVVLCDLHVVNSGACRNRFSGVWISCRVTGFALGKNKVQHRPLIGHEIGD